MAQFRLPKGSNNTEAMRALVRLLLVAVALTATLAAGDNGLPDDMPPPDDGQGSGQGPGPGPGQGQGQGQGPGPGPGPGSGEGSGPGPRQGQGSGQGPGPGPGPGSGEGPGPGPGPGPSLAIPPPGGAPPIGYNPGDGGPGQGQNACEPKECSRHCKHDKTKENGICRKDGFNIVCYCEPKCPIGATGDGSGTRDLYDIADFCANDGVDEDDRGRKCCNKCKFIGYTSGFCAMDTKTGMQSCQCSTDQSTDQRPADYSVTVTTNDNRPDPCAPPFGGTSMAQRDGECYDQCQMKFTQKGQCKPDEGADPALYQEVCFCEQFGYSVFTNAFHQAIENEVYGNTPDDDAKKAQNCRDLCTTIGYKKSNYKEGKENKDEKECSCLIRIKTTGDGAPPEPEPEPEPEQEPHSHRGHGHAKATKGRRDESAAGSDADEAALRKDKKGMIRKGPKDKHNSHKRTVTGAHFVNIRDAASVANDVCSVLGSDSANNRKCVKECTEVKKKGGECKITEQLFGPSKECYCEENPVLTRLIQPPVDDGGPGDGYEQGPEDQQNGGSGYGYPPEPPPGPPGPPEPPGQNYQQGGFGNNNR